MAIPTTAMGLDAIVYSGGASLFAYPPETESIINAVLTSGTHTFVAGQVFVKNSAGTYDAVSSKTGFGAIAVSVSGAHDATTVTSTGTALVPNYGVLMEAVSQTATIVGAVLCVKGNFIQSALTPNDLPKGAYCGGAFIIEGEIV